MQQATLSLVRGDDQDLGILLRNPDTTPYNLSGCMLSFVARESSYFSPIVITKNVVSFVDPAAGSGQFSFVPSDTQGLADTPFYFDIKLTTATSKITTLCYGTLTIVPI